MNKAEYKALKDVIDVCFFHIENYPSDFTKEELAVITAGSRTLFEMREKSEKQIEKAKHIMKEKRSVDRTYGRGKMIAQGYYKDNGTYWAKKFNSAKKRGATK
jgi:hypothetical protein